MHLGAFVAALIAFGDPVMGVPVSPTENIGPPITINECRLLESGNQLVTTSSGVQMQFTNETEKTAELINFAVGDGHQSATIRDVGTFSPGITVIHKYKIGAGETFSPLFDAPRLHCSVDSIKFTDGTIWRNNAAPLVPNDQASPAPIAHGGNLVVYPNRLVLSGVGGPQALFFIAQSMDPGAIAQTNTCASIADVSWSLQFMHAAVFKVVPRAKGSCTVTLRTLTGDSATMQIVSGGP